jgi:drug/metabolite transporter (DMT)-like permease
VPWIVASAVTGDLAGVVTLSAPTLILLILLGVIGTGFTYGLWSAALSKLSAASVAVFQYAIPFWAIVLSVGLLGEHVTISLAVGGIGIVAGIAITQRSTLR